MDTRSAPVVYLARLRAASHALVALGALLAALTATGCGRGKKAASPVATRQGALQEPAWAPGVLYSVGQRVRYQSIVFQCISAHRSIVTWEPPNARTLWVRPTPGVQPSVWTDQTRYPA